MDDELQVSELSEEEWERIPVRQRSRWDELLDRLTDGKSMLLRFSDPVRIRGAKTALGKCAKKRGMSLQFKDMTDGTPGIAVRAVVQIVPPSKQATQKKPRGRPRKAHDEKVVPRD